MSNPNMWPWPDPTNHEIQMLRTKCMELEEVNKAQAEQIKRLQAYSAVLCAKLGIYGFADEIPEALGILNDGDLEEP